MLICSRKTFVSPEDVVAQQVKSVIKASFMCKFCVFHLDFVNKDDAFCLQIVVQKNSPRGLHFRRAGPREKVCSFLKKYLP